MVIMEVLAITDVIMGLVPYNSDLVRYYDYNNGIVGHNYFFNRWYGSVN